MISHWLKVVYLLVFLADLWIITDVWNSLGGGEYGVIFLAIALLNFTMGMGLIQLSYLYSIRHEMENLEEEEEVKVVSYTSSIPPSQSSRVITLVDSREESPDLPPVS